MHGPVQPPWAYRGQSPCGETRWEGQACKSVSSCTEKLSGDKTGHGFAGQLCTLVPGPI